MKIREEPNKIQDLPGRASRFLESKESKGRCKVSETLPKARHEAGYLEVVYSELLEVCECGKAMEVISAKPFGSKLAIKAQTDTESLDEWKQPEVVRLLERCRPPAPLVPVVGCQIIGDEGVVKMGEGGDIPRIAGQGACQDGVGVVNEVGENCVHKFSRKLGN